MRQALHIFYKDIRQLRYDIIVTLVLTATCAWYVGHRTPLLGFQTDKLNLVADLLGLLLPFAWGYLVARAIYGEPLPGDRLLSWISAPGCRHGLVTQFKDVTVVGLSQATKSVIISCSWLPKHVPTARLRNRRRGLLHRRRRRPPTQAPN